MQEYALNSLNMILVHTPLQDQHVAPFLSDRHLFLRAISLLSHDQAPMRVHPKAFLACALLLRLGSKWLCCGLDADLLGRTEGTPSRKATARSGCSGGESPDRELKRYTGMCIEVMLNVVIEGAPQLLEEVCSKLLYRFIPLHHVKGSRFALLTFMHCGLQSMSG